MIVPRADVANAGEALFQGDLGVRHRVDRLVGDRLPHLLGVPAVSRDAAEVDMAIEESGKDGVAAQIQHGRTRRDRNRPRWADGGDPLSFDHHLGVQDGRDIGADNEPVGPDHQCSFGLPSGRRQRVATTATPRARVKRQNELRIGNPSGRSGRSVPGFRVGLASYAGRIGTLCQGVAIHRSFAALAGRDAGVNTGVPSPPRCDAVRRSGLRSRRRHSAGQPGTFLPMRASPGRAALRGFRGPPGKIRAATESQRHARFR